MRRRTFIQAGAVAACTFSLPAFADGYPDKPVKVYQGFATGGNADTIARLVGNEMAKVLGQPFVHEAQTGAGGTIASTTVARAKPDGYTLLLATGGHAVAGALYAKLPYDTVADFQMISTVTFFPFLLVVRADSPYRSLSEVLKAAQADPRACPTARPAWVRRTTWPVSCWSSAPACRCCTFPIGAMRPR